MHLLWNFLTWKQFSAAIQRIKGKKTQKQKQVSPQQDTLYMLLSKKENFLKSRRMYAKGRTSIQSIRSAAVFRRKEDWIVFKSSIRFLGRADEKLESVQKRAEMVIKRL